MKGLIKVSLLGVGISVCLGMSNFLFDDKIILSTDSGDKVLIDKKISEGFETVHITYEDGWINGVRRKWERKREKVYLPSVRMLTIPKDHFKGLELFFNLASIPQYGSHMRMSLDTFADVLWAWAIVRIRPDAVALDGPREEKKTKRECLLENIYLLLRNTPGLREEMHSILSEVEKIPLMHTMPSIHNTPRERIIWFMQQKEQAEPREFIEFCLFGQIKRAVLYVEMIGDVDIGNTARVVVRETDMNRRSVVKNRAHQEKERQPPSLVPFYEFILSRPLQQIVFLDILIEGQAVLTEDALSYIFIIFTSVSDLSLDHPEGHIHTEECTSLLTALLKSEERRSSHGLNKIVKGLVLAHTLFLTHENIAHLENTHLKKFGFKSYYPSTYSSEEAYKKIKPYTDRFMDRFFLGEVPLSQGIVHLVAPDSLYFAQDTYSRMPSVSTVEICIQNDPWLDGELGKFIFPSSQIRRVIITEESPDILDSRTHKVLSGLSALQKVESLDVSETSLSPSSLIAILIDARTQYRHVLRSISFTYRAEGSSISLLSRYLPSIELYKVSIPYSPIMGILPHLVEDLQKAFVTHSRAQRMYLQLETIWRDRKTFKRSRYSPSRSQISQAYKESKTKEGPNQYEMMLILKEASKH